MKRNILTLSLAALIGCTAISPVAAQSAPQRLMKGDRTANVSVAKDNPLKKNRALHNAKKADALAGASQGFLAIPGAASRPANLMTRSVHEPRGHFYGNVGDFGSMSSVDQAFMGVIDVKTGDVTNLFSNSGLINGNDYDFQGGATRDGVFYTVLAGSDMEGDFVQWNRFDLETGDALTPIRFGYGDFSAYAYAMTYNEKEDLFYCLCIDATSGSANVLSIIDPNNKFQTTSSVILSAGAGEFVGGIAYCPADEEVYVFTDSGNIYTVKAGDKSMVQAGQFLNADCPIEGNVSTQVCYSPLDEAFAIIIRDPQTYSIKLGMFDMYDWEVVDAVVLGNSKYSTPYFSALQCSDPYAVNDAPELPAKPEISFVDNSLTGSIKVTVPAMNFAGVALKPTDKVNLNVKIDGESVINKDCAPGAVETLNTQLSQALHTMEIICTIDGNVSPVRTVKFYVGNDSPNAPKNVKMNNENTVLSWDAPGAVGANGGYVDVNALTYDVYFDGVKQNTEPIKDTKFAITHPDKLKFINATVVATANGVSSADGKAEIVVGKALSLPANLEPTVEESELFQIFNPGNDDTKFEFTNNDGYLHFLCYVGNYDRANDWLILPLINFPDASHLYNFSFTFSNAQVEGKEALEIFVGKQATPTAEGKFNIFKQDAMDSTDDKTYDVNFAVPEAGDYYIAIHCKSIGGDAGGVRLNNFNVTSRDNMSSDVPADVTEVKFTPAPLGGLSTKLAITAPTLNSVGAPLPTDKDITFTVKCGDETVTATAKPGAVANAEIAVAKSGYSLFHITPKNENGEGMTRDFRQYVGVDRPLCPNNIVGTPSEDNLSLVLTWEKPSSVGANGGYVDADNLNYRIYNVVGASWNPVDVTKNLTYTFTPSSKVQERYIVGPSAYNEVAESSNSLFLGDILGEPNRLPVKEEFNESMFSYNPTYHDLDGEFQNSMWQNIGSIQGSLFKHNCKQDLTNGGLMSYNTGTRPTKSQLVTPKFTTKDIKEASYTLRYLDFTYAPDMEVWVRHDGHATAYKLADITPLRDGDDRWIDKEIILPESILGKGWVQILLRVNHTTERNEYCFIDSYTISQNADNDLAAKSVVGPATAFTGESPEYTCTFVNAGRTMASGGKVILQLLDKNGKQLLRQDLSLPRIQSLDERSVVFKAHIEDEYREVAPLTMRATVDYPNDEVEWNNVVETKINITEFPSPVVRDLAGEWDDDETEVTLNWSEPANSFKGNEPFEMYNGFDTSEDFGIWKNIDMDGLEVFGFNGLNWPGMTDPQGWMVVSTDDFNVWAADPRMAPHSGKNYIMARTPYYDDLDYESKPQQAADWLVSPEVEPGSELSFWYNTISPDYTEYLELWYSSTDDNLGNFISDPTGNKRDQTCGSFKYVRTFSKEGADAWEHVTVTLPADCKYFALVYRSIDSFGAMLDDIVFSQKNPRSFDIDKYEVYRIENNDWNTFKCLGTVDKATTTFVDKTVGADEQGNRNNPSYWVQTYVKVGDELKTGPRSNRVNVYTMSVDGIQDGSMSVTGDKGMIRVNGFAGKLMKVYTTDGKIIREVSIRSAAETINAAPGIYMVKIGKDNFKVLVK